MKTFQEIIKYVNENHFNKENSKEFMFVKKAIKDGYNINSIKTAINFEKSIQDGILKISDEDKNNISQEQAYKMLTEIWALQKKDKSEQDKNFAKHITSKVEELLTNLESPETEKELKKYFKSVSHFNNYSFKNIMFLHGQAEELGKNITFVESAKNWKEKGAMIHKGESSYKVFAPKQNYEFETEIDNNGKETYKKDDQGKYIYKLDDQGNKIKKNVSFIQVPVFDASQTDAIEKGIIQKLNYRNSDVDISDEMYKEIVDEVSQAYNIKINTKDDNNEFLGGYYTPNNASIFVNSKNRSNAEKVSTLFHELGHHILHNKDDYNAIHLDKGMKEGEAESVSYILSSKLNIENNSELYLKSWQQDTQTIMNQIERITNASKEVMNKIDFEKIMNNEYERTFENIANKKQQNLKINESGQELMNSIKKAGDKNTPIKELERLAYHTDTTVKKELISNEATPIKVLEILTKDENASVFASAEMTILKRIANNFSNSEYSVEDILHEIKNIEIASPDFSKSKSKSTDVDVDTNKVSKTKRNRQ